MQKYDSIDWQTKEDSRMLAFAFWTPPKFTTTVKLKYKALNIAVLHLTTTKNCASFPAFRNSELNSYITDNTSPNSIVETWLFGCYQLVYLPGWIVWPGPSRLLDSPASAEAENLWCLCCETSTVWGFSALLAWRKAKVKTNPFFSLCYWNRVDCSLLFWN